MAKKKAKMLQITQVRSGIGRQGTHRRTLRALGIKWHQHCVVQEDTPAIQGMIRQVAYLVEVKELDS